MSIGYIFAILTGIFYGIQGAFGKLLTGRMPPIILSWGIFTFTLPYMLILLLIEGIPRIIWKEFIWATTGSLILNFVSWYLFFLALQKSSLAKTMPFTSFSPLFMIPIAYIILGEFPNPKGILGIFLIISGAFGIYMKSSNPVDTIRNIVEEKGTRIMLIVALTWSISATFEKVAVLNSSQAFYGTAIEILLSLAYLPYLFRKEYRKGRYIRRNISIFLVFGLISALMLIFQFTAIKHILVSYVIAFKRAGVIVSVLLGILFFKEKNAVRNIISTLLMITGVFLILL